MSGSAPGWVMIDECFVSSSAKWCECDSLLWSSFLFSAHWTQILWHLTSCWHLAAGVSRCARVPLLKEIKSSDCYLVFLLKMQRSKSEPVRNTSEAGVSEVGRRRSKITFWKDPKEDKKPTDWQNLYLRQFLTISKLDWSRKSMKPLRNSPSVWQILFLVESYPVARLN